MRRRPHVRATHAYRRATRGGLAELVLYLRATFPSAATVIRDIGPSPSSLLLETHLFKRGRPGIGVDQHQRRLRHARPDTTRPDVFPDGSKSHPIVERLLNLVQQSLAL